MINKIGKALAVVSAFSCSPAAFSIEITAINASNQILTCHSPLLEGSPKGSCLAVPDNTLYVTATLEDGEDESVLDEMTLVFQHKGNSYQYDSSGMAEINNPTGRWKVVSSDQAQAAASFKRLPMEGKSMTRQVSFAPFAKQSGATLHVGTRSSRDIESFIRQPLKHVFTIR
jgi:hypothetical protein